MKKTLFTLFLLCSVCSFSQTERQTIQNYLEKNKATFNLSSDDIQDWSVQSRGNSESMGTDNIYIIQQYGGTEVFNALSTVALKNANVSYFANNFIANLRSKIANATYSYSASQALNKVYSLLDINVTDVISVISSKDTKHIVLTSGIGLDEHVLANLVYQKNNLNKYVLCWDLTIHTVAHNHLWSIRLNANDGSIVQKQDMVVSCNFNDSRSKLCSHVDNTKTVNVNHFSLNKTSTSLAPLAGSYRVIPSNIESPNHGNFQLISNPANLSASPKEWHDANSSSGTSASLKYAYLRGNNVWARADYSNTNPTAHSTTTSNNGYSPINAALNFDFSYNGTSVAANTSIDAAATNLFYMNNIMHDVWWQYGFNEVNGNFQQNNYGKGGAQNDSVMADAQDGSTAATPTLNNANFSTPVDGQGGRMQMYLWSYRKLTELLTVNSPADIAGGKIAGDNGFNPGHVDVPVAPNMIQSNLVLMDDGTPDIGQTDNADGCGPAVNTAAISGKIVVIRRSTSTANGGNPCTFVDKVVNGQAAGATAVIIVNNDLTAPNSSIGMSGANASITIPVISLSKNNGEAIIAKLKAGQVVNAKIQSATAISLFVNTDGDFDNGVIGHEFGHGISTRLAGGPGNSSCLQNYDQMGEGWSDWFALMMQLKAGDVGSAKRGIGTFVMNQAPTDDGLRSFPYSTDMTKNPLTYNDSNSPVPADPTDTGYRYVNGDFWATTLWDLTWAYINKYGFDSNIYTGVGGNNKVMRLVLDGLKLQPCSPTVVSARNALFAAEQNTTNGVDYCMIAEVFRRRGVGLNASAGAADDCSDQVQDFTPFANGPNCTMVLGLNYYDKSNINIYPNPSNGLFNLRINQYDSNINVQVVDINGRIILENKNVRFNTEGAIDLRDFQSGIYVVKITGDNLNYTQKIIKN